MDLMLKTKKKWKLKHFYCKIYKLANILICALDLDKMKLLSVCDNI